MPKTYTALTVANATAGNAILASDFSSVFTNLNNMRVPPSCHVYRTSDLTSYTDGTAITWQAEAHDTDDMWSSGTNITIQTAGIYLCVFKVQTAASGTAMTYAAPQLLVNGTAAMQLYNASVFSGIVSQGFVTYVASFAAATTIAANVLVSGATSYTIKGGTLHTTSASSLSVTWLGQAS
jgi:hypothetical protein